MQKAGDHLADLFGKLSTVFSQSEEEATRVFDCVGSCGGD